MKPYLIMAVVSAAATPVVVESTIGTIDPASFDEDSDLMRKAQELAKEHFSASAGVTVRDVQVVDQRTGAFGERIEPDPGYHFHVATVSIENTGKVDLAVSNWHFSGIDEAGSDHFVELGNAHEDFDASRLGSGHTRAGRVIFELAQGSWLTAVTWQGDLAEASGTAPAYAHP